MSYILSDSVTGDCQRRLQRNSCHLPARATQLYTSRLLLDNFPEATSDWKDASQNCVPACTFRARYLRTQPHSFQEAGTGGNPVLPGPKCCQMQGLQPGMTRRALIAGSCSVSGMALSPRTLMSGREHGYRRMRSPALSILGAQELGTVDACAAPPSRTLRLLPGLQVVEERHVT